MASNKVNARIQMKRDTAANWTSTNPVLLNGERIIVDTASGEMRYKVGDGTKTFTELPFDDEIMRENINAAQATADTALETANEKLDEFQGTENADKLLGIDSDGYITPVAKPTNATQSSAGLMSASDKTKLDKIEAGAQANKNAFSKIAIGSTTISADSASDMLTLAAGSNITIQPATSSSKITISATDTTYTHPASGVTAGTYKSVTVNSQGHVTSGSNPTTLSGYGITDAASLTALNDSAASTLSSANEYTDGKIADLIDGAPSTLDTLNEIATAMSENASVVETLDAAIGAKASSSDLSSHTGNKSNPHGVTLGQLGVTATASELNMLDGVTDNIQFQLDKRSVNGHSHEMATVVGLRDALDEKAALSHGNHVPTTETTNNAKFLRNDNTWAMVTPANIGAATSSHTHSSYANQNAFSNVTIGSTTIAADTTTDTLTLVAGSNVTLIPDATNDKITIAATNTVYTHPTSSGNKHIPAGGSSGQILRWYADGTAVWGADNNTTYNAATQSAAGLMSAADKTKLDGIASGANNYSLPTASSSTLGGVKTTSTTTSTSGLTACPIISGVVYYKNTTYGSASTSAAGLMSAADKTKLDGIASGANNYTYTLPNATSSTLGGVKVGSNITVSSGTISLTKSNITTALGYTPPATNTTYTAGTGISISSDNQISCTVSAYSLPSATLSTLGGVRFSYGSLSSRPSTATTGAIYLATS